MEEYVPWPSILTNEGSEGTCGVIVALGKKGGVDVGISVGVGIDVVPFSSMQPVKIIITMRAAKTSKHTTVFLFISSYHFLIALSYNFAVSHSVIVASRYIKFSIYGHRFIKCTIR